MELTDRNILVTGAGGFIASHLVEQLAEVTDSIRAFVRYNSRSDYGLLDRVDETVRSSLDVVSGDLKDYDAVFQAVRDIDVIFHLGAIISIPYSYEHPNEVIRTNVIGSTNVLLAAREHDVRKVVQTSTSEVYGTAQYVPIDEDHPLQGQSPYSASKIGADKIAESFYTSFDLPVTTLRPFNAYGPRQSSRAVIPTIIRQLLDSNEVNLGSLHPTRDFTYVKDTVDAFVKMARSEENNGEVVNAGSSDEISIGDLAELIADIMDRDLSITQEDQRKRPDKSEVDRLYCENEKARELIDWEPEYSLRDGLEETINWIRQNRDFYRQSGYVV